VQRLATDAEWTIQSLISTRDNTVLISRFGFTAHEQVSYDLLHRRRPGVTLDVLPAG
jgi:hypothetical protein